MDENAWQNLMAPWKIPAPPKVYKPVGCLECRNTGYLGREGIYEILTASEPSKAMITDDCNIDELRKIKPSINLDEHVELADDKDQFDSHSDELKWLNIQISQLPFFQREALCLQLEGFSLDDIAEMSHCSVDTIKSRLKLARKKLKDTNKTDREEVNHETI